MIRVALICADEATRTRVRGAFNRCTQEARLGNTANKAFACVDDVLATIPLKRGGYIDYVICCIDSASPSFDGLRALCGGHPDIALSIISADPAHASVAYELGADFLLLSGAYDDFKSMVVERLVRIARGKTQRIAVRSSGSVNSVVLDDVQFVESSKKGSVMHLPDGQTVVARATLQSLFSSLCQAAGQELGANSDEPFMDPQRPASCFFVKAGSSFIVNLDNVRSAGEGSFVFADGETIIIPIRKRKALKDALAAYRAG